MVLGPAEIERIIPHRGSMLLVHFVDYISADGMSIKGGLVLSGRESFFDGHFPAVPLMPGVMIIEAIAQLGACLMSHHRYLPGTLPVLTTVRDFTFLRPVVPDNILVTEFSIISLDGCRGEARGKALIGGTEVAKGVLGFKQVQSATLLRLARRPAIKVMASASAQ